MENVQDVKISSIPYLAIYLHRVLIEFWNLKKQNYVDEPSSEKWNKLKDRSLMIKNLLTILPVKMGWNAGPKPDDENKSTLMNRPTLKTSMKEEEVKMEEELLLE